jgi:D-amino-acid dehydrogenase
VPFEVLDREGFCRVEPALKCTQHKFVGALRLPNDQTGDCHLFTNRLAEMAMAMGVRFRFDTSIEGLERAGDRITGVRTGAGTLTADRYLLALDSFSPKLLQPLGLRIPVYPVKGCWITVPITDAAHAPEPTIMDETHKVAVTRPGDRIRVGGSAGLAGHSEVLREPRRATLEHVVTDLFPRGGDVAKATFWCGLRQMTPDGTPLVGPTRIANLLLATGHGTLGWTMARGTGRVIADLVCGRTPEIDTRGLAVARYA